MEIKKYNVKNNSMLRKALDGAKRMAPTMVLAASSLAIAPKIKAQEQPQWKSELARREAEFELCVQEQQPIPFYPPYYGWYFMPYNVNAAASATCKLEDDVARSQRRAERNAELKADSKTVEDTIDSALKFAIEKGTELNGKGVESKNASFTFGIEKATGEVRFAKTNKSYPVVYLVTMNGYVDTKSEHVNVNRKYLVGQGPDNTLFAVRVGSGNTWNISE